MLQLEAAEVIHRQLVTLDIPLEDLRKEQPDDLMEGQLEDRQNGAVFLVAIADRLLVMAVAVAAK